MSLKRTTKCAWLVLLAGVTSSSLATQLSPEAFKQPAKNYLPKTWMHAMNGNMSKPGFSGDFKAMKDAGIGGAIFFHVHRRNKPYSSRGPVRFGTDEFFDHLVHAAAAADKNDIEFGVHNADGWTSSGGPWITPEMSMKRITWSELAVEGGKNVIPPQPGYYEGFYRDVAVIALPANKYNQSNAFANAKITSSNPNLDTSVLTDNDWDTEFKFTDQQDSSSWDSKPTSDNNKAHPYWLQIEVEHATTLRSLHIETPNRHGDALLQISDDGVNFKTVVNKLRRPRPGARLWAFSPQLVSAQQDGFTAKYFRLVFDNPITIKRFDLWSIPRFDNWFSMNSMERGKLSLTPTLAADAITKASDVIVLNRGELPKEGVALPEGNWRVLRFGYTSTGAYNVPATVEGEGLEVDKFDAKALRFHFEQYVGKLVDKAKAKGIKSLKTTEIDSYEVGGQNWTQNIDQSFKAKFDYDFIPWLPLMTGRVIESPEHTGGILQEFRQHLSDLMVENYFGEFTRISNEYGLEAYIEPYGWGPFDELASGGKADRLMGEFWVKSPFGKNKKYHGRTSAAISSGHIYGKKIISAESFTSINVVHWSGHPYYYKHHGDHMWTRGINETMFHRFAHQPNNHIKPGMTMDSIGSHFDRTQTWWYNGGAEWFKYLARGSYLLQQGVPDADLLVHVGDAAPVRGGSSVQVPAGFKYDLVNSDVLLNRMSVRDGYLVLPEGTRYRALYLNKTDYMHFKTLERIAELVAAGATVIGEKPQKVIGYSEWPQQAEFSRIANQLWGNESDSIITYEKGVVSSYNLVNSINKLGFQPDLIIDGQPMEHFAKRRIGENTLYFFHNEFPELKQVNLDVRDGDGQPEIWNIDDGSIEKISQFSREGTRLKTSLTLEPHASRFVLIRRDNSKVDYTSTHSTLVNHIYSQTANKSQTLTGNWAVEFDRQWAGPGKTIFTGLTDWVNHSDEGIKYYSGTAVYSKPFNVSADDIASSRHIYLDLGDVQQIAEVSINGIVLKTLWKPPFALDIKPAVQAGFNELQVKVTNTWVNRLIGDEALPDTSGYKMTGDTVPWLNANQKPPKSQRVTFTGYNFFKKESAKKLQSSGLLGPVRLINF
ncbi:family 2 glycoside hydrolase [Catenovulum agarivorans DS-2]|uniref:Family 2 glycoside hydrolase n=1 Tax=Catenovulum agarivorans DS-2 TaxID=1328313 RepID=W7QL34_9ALTE|nr:glycosyl hydrolase [Catenovulum agarivorans]EWH08843.1 family 2 glycoside hydrolase [Catenovulum agarivorans DS-2]